MAHSSCPFRRSHDRLCTQNSSHNPDTFRSGVSARQSCQAPTRIFLFLPPPVAPWAHHRSFPPLVQHTRSHSRFSYPCPGLRLGPAPLPQATENALRHQKADAYLIERDARASLLSLAAARAFRQGRERVQAARALGFLRDTARRRRFASAAAAKTSNIRASRCLRVWTTAAKRTRRQQAASSCASAFAAEFAARSAKDAARRFLRQWAEGSRRRRDALAAAERLRVRRQRAALFSWRDACRNREALAAASREIATRLARSSARRALRGWREATFGGLSGSAGGDFVAAANEGGGEGRVLARLMDVGVRVDEAGARRRAKKALRDWLARAKGARRRVLVER